MKYSTASLPTVDQILQDFLSVGGSLKEFFARFISIEQERKVVAINLLTLLEQTPEHKMAFDRIRRHGAAIEAMLAEDELIEIARLPGSKQRVPALRLVLDRQRELEEIGAKLASQSDSALDQLVKQLSQ